MPFYNRERAVAYAHRWAFSRNPAYYNFDAIGGDCTNFVSQCLFAGSGRMHYRKVYGCYYNDLNDRARLEQRAISLPLFNDQFGKRPLRRASAG